MKTGKKAAVGFIFITLLIDVIGIGIIIPVIPKLLTEMTGDTLGEASRDGGWLAFAYAITQFVFAPIVGGLSDRFGRRPVLLASLFGFAVDYLFLAYAPTLAWLYVGRVIAGIMGASFTTGAAYMADISTPEKRAQNFGLIGAAFGLGFIIGPVLGGVLGEYGSRIPFLAAAGLSFLNFLYGWFILPESLLPENRRPFDWKRANPFGALKQLRKYPVFSSLILSLALLYTAIHAVQSNWTYYTKEKFAWSESEIGLSLGMTGLLSVLVQGYLIRKIIPALGQAKTVYTGLALYAIGFFLFGIATEGWMMYLFMIPYVFGGIGGPAIQGIISTQVPPNEQGELQGGLTSLMSFTSILGPPLMTNVFAWFSDKNASFYLPGAPMFLASALTIIGALVARKNLKKSS